MILPWRCRILFVIAVWMRIVLLILIRVAIWKLLTSAIGGGRHGSLVTTSSWSRWYVHTPTGCLYFGFVEGLSTAIERDHGGVRYVSLTNWALWVLIRSKGSTLDKEPFVDAGPAVEVATVCDHWLVC